MCMQTPANARLTLEPVPPRASGGVASVPLFVEVGQLADRFPAHCRLTNQPTGLAPLPPRPGLWCRALYLPELDQEQMLAIRAAWFEENFGAPPGNKRARFLCWIAC